MVACLRRHCGHDVQVLAVTLTVGRLLADRALHLVDATGGIGHGRVVEAAHVTELTSPGPWLQGGELLMTIGLLLDDEAAQRAWVEQAAAAGVSALAVGLGASLPFQQAPPAMVAAAREAGVPLLAVPDDVPFIAVTKAVFAARAAAERDDLERAVAAHRALTAAAAGSGGLEGLLTVWWRTSGVPAVVVDPVGRLLASAGSGAGWLVLAARDGLEQVAGHGLRAAASVTVGAHEARLHPLGTRRVRGLLAVGGPGDGSDRLVLQGMVSLLSLDLERRHLMGADRRRERAELVGRLLSLGGSAGGSGGEDGAAASALLRVAGLPDRVRGLAVAASGPDAGEVAADLALALPGGLVRVDAGLVEAVVGHDVDVVAVLARFAGGLAAGVGPVVAGQQAGASVREARAAVAASRRSGRVVASAELASVRLLLSLADDGLLGGFADAVLTPIEMADASGALVATLSAWLDAAGSAEETARRLGVHRHTVRNRLDRIEVLTGRALDEPAQRYELWLALQARG